MKKVIDNDIAKILATAGGRKSILGSIQRIKQEVAWQYISYELQEQLEAAQNMVNSTDPDMDESKHWRIRVIREQLENSVALLDNLQKYVIELDNQSEDIGYDDFDPYSI